MPANWTSKEIEFVSEDGSKNSGMFVNMLDSEKEGIIEAINSIQDVSKREAFGNSEKTITFNNGKKQVTYEFNKKGDKKYDLV